MFCTNFLTLFLFLLTFSGFFPVSGESSEYPLFGGNSFLKQPPLGVGAQDNIDAKLEIFPLEKTGILLYNGWEPRRIGDFISVSIKDGLVELSFDCRSGPVKIRREAFFF